MEENFNTPDMTGMPPEMGGMPPEYPQAPQIDCAENYKQAKRAYSLSLLNILFFGLAAQGLVLVIMLVLKLMGMADNMNGNVKYILNFVPMYLVAFPLFWLLGKKIEAAPPKQHDMKFGHWVIALIMCFALMVAGALIGNIINLVLAALFGIKIDASALNEGLLGEGAWTLTFFAVIGAPIVEELVFRKFLIDRVRRYGEGTAILVSGIMFGLFHGNFSQCFFAAFLGFFFAFIYVRTGKIRYTIALHMAINFVGSVISGSILRSIDYQKYMDAAENGNIEELVKLLPDLVPLLVFLVFEYGLALAGLILLIVNVKKFRVSQPEVPVQKGKLFQAVWINLGSILLLLFCAALFVFTAIQLFGKAAS